MGIKEVKINYCNGKVIFKDFYSEKKEIPCEKKLKNLFVEYCQEHCPHEKMYVYRSDFGSTMWSMSYQYGLCCIQCEYISHSVSTGPQFKYWEKTYKEQKVKIRVENGESKDSPYVIDWTDYYQNNKAKEELKNE